jgi:hypothetical protein
MFLRKPFMIPELIDLIYNFRLPFVFLFLVLFFFFHFLSDYFVYEFCYVE